MQINSVLLELEKTASGLKQLALQSTDLIQRKGTYPYHNKTTSMNMNSSIVHDLVSSYRQEFCKLIVGVSISLYCHVHIPTSRHLFLKAFAKTVY
jgi:hypothetical protein